MSLFAKRFRSSPANAPVGEDQTVPDLSQTVVLATIRALGYSYATVSLPDGGTAVLPWRELWPKFKVHDKYSDFLVTEDSHKGATIVRACLEEDSDPSLAVRPIREDDRILVIAFDKEFDKEHRSIVSHIRACSNPWEKVAAWNDRDIRSFVVEFITDSWAWGTVDPGIRARVSLEGIDALLPSERWHGHQTPLPGDEIAAWFLKDEVDEKQQIVTLDYANYVRSQGTPCDLLFTEETTSIPPVPRDLSSDKVESIPSLANRRSVKTVLLLDDDDAFRDSLRDYLEYTCSIKVLAASAENSAMNIVREQGADVDLAIIDVNLEKFKDHRGIHVAHFLRECFPHCPIVLTTGEEINPTDQRIRDVVNVTVHAIAYKPFGIDSLHRALSACVEDPKPLPYFCRSTRTTPSRNGETRLTDIQASLRDLRSSTSADAAVLFRIHPVTEEVIIRALEGPPSTYHHDKERLAWSPIRNAAINGEEIFTACATNEHEFPRHRYLLRAYRYKSCVGVPVYTGAVSHFAYCLFVFHPEKNRFNQSRILRLVKRVAKDVGFHLRLEQLEEETRAMKPFEMMGQAYGSMAHDLSKNLSSDFMLDEIEKSILSNDRASALDTLARAKGRIQRAQRIVRAFRDMARGQHVEIQTFSAAQEIGKIAEHIEAHVAEYRVDLRWCVDLTQSCLLTMRTNNLEQLFVNLVLNAAQQISRLSETIPRAGRILISVAEEADHVGMNWLVARVADNGPGIHRRDFDRVFDILYTTKEQGCGMGLDICRKIATSVESGRFRGSVVPSRSVLLCGTVFEVRLPVS